VEVILINRFETVQFKPLLPDIISRTIPTRYLVRPLEFYGHQYGFRFLLDEVEEIDPERGIVRARHFRLPYDFLILATGSEANFFGNQSFIRRALKLDDVFDGERIAYAVSRGGYDRFVISGGGYTGVEIASHIRKSLESNSLRKEIFIVELGDSILGPLPDWMKKYIFRNLEDQGIHILLGTKVADIEDRNITLSDGQSFSNGLLVWTTGMKTPDLVDRLDMPKEAQGRLAVDSSLRFRANAYAVGNTGCYKQDGSCPRMAAQAAVRQGILAAANIVRELRGQSPRKYKIVDYGYFVPMANGRSCGRLLGINVTGRTATFLHYLISAYRAHGSANKWGVLQHALV
jgi:NADH dehydrogenase